MGTSDDDSPSPPTPRGHRRRTCSPSPRGRNGGHGRTPRTSLMVRNLGPYCRPNDLRGPFGRFGDLKGVYLPKDYYTREPRGFGFVEYFDPENASNAKSHMDGQKLLGREINVVFARYSRSTPSAMRAIERSGGGPSCDRRLRSRSPGYHDSPRGRSWSRSRSYSPAPKRKHYSRSPSPRPRERSSPADSRSKSASPGASRSKSASPAENNMGTSDDDSPSPPRGHRRRTRSPSPPGRYRGHGRPPRTSLMVRNLGPYCRRYDLRGPFERFGRVKDIYLPKDYYTRQPRRFGFVEYFDPKDASNAKSHMDGQILLGKEINVGFARHSRSTPSAMRAIERSGGGPSCDRRSRSRSPGYHDSPRSRSRSRSRSYSPAQHYSRSPSPRPRERSSPADSRSKSASPGASRSPPRQRSPSGGE